MRPQTQIKLCLSLAVVAYGVFFVVLFTRSLVLGSVAVIVWIAALLWAALTAVDNRWM